MSSQKIRWALTGYLTFLVLSLAWMQYRSTGANSDSQIDQPDFLIISRHALGVSQIPSIGANQVFDNAILDQLRSIATTPERQVRLVIIVGELQGKDAALKELEAIAALDDPKLNENLASLKLLYQAGVDQVPAEQQQNLKANLGWFGDIALVFGEKPSNPARKAALRPAIMMELVFVIAFFSGSFMLLLGAVLLVIGSMWVVSGKIVPVYPSLQLETGPDDSIFLEITVLALSSMVLVSQFGHHLPRSAAILTQLSLAFWPAWGLLRGLSARSLRLGLGWYPGKGILREIGAGIVGYLAGLPILGAGLVITVLLSSIAGTTSGHPISKMIEGASPEMLLYLGFLACVLAPFVEETLFRGALFHHFRSRWKVPAAALIQGFIFAAIHPQGWIGVPALMALGTVFGLIREWRGSLIAAIVAHGINNGLVLGLCVILLR